VNEIKSKIVESLQVIDEWCKNNDLIINYEKTNFMIFHKEKDLTIRNESISTIKVNNNIINRVYKFKYLGVWLDPSLNFNEHYNTVINKVSHKIKFLNGVKRYIPQSVMPVIFNAYIHSYIDYALEIWCVQPDTMLKNLQKIVDSFLVSYYYSSKLKKFKSRRNFSENDFQELRDKCKFLTVTERAMYVTLKLAYKEFYTNPLFIVQTEHNNSSTLSRAKIHAHNSQIYKKCINYRASCLWNMLPRSWTINKWTYSMYKDQVKKWIAKNRNDEFVYQ